MKNLHELINKEFDIVDEESLSAYIAHLFEHNAFYHFDDDIYEITNFVEAGQKVFNYLLNHQLQIQELRVEQKICPFEVAFKVNSQHFGE